MAAPYQVKFCYALQEYFNAEIWFYVHLEKNRPKWWKLPLGDKCKVLEGSFYLPVLNYNNFNLLREVKKFNPDILLLGGFFLPSHYILKQWAQRNKKKVVMLSERIALIDSNSLASKIKRFIKKLNLSLFKDADLIFAMGEKPRDQFINEFGFDADKVVYSPISAGY
jgi:hypothetical protein